MEGLHLWHLVAIANHFGVHPQVSHLAIASSDGILLLRFGEQSDLYQAVVVGQDSGFVWYYELQQWVTRGHKPADLGRQLPGAKRSSHVSFRTPAKFVTNDFRIQG